MTTATRPEIMPDNTYALNRAFRTSMADHAGGDVVGADRVQPAAVGGAGQQHPDDDHGRQQKQEDADRDVGT